MEKEFVPYPLALRLKELGFDEPCIAWYYGVDLWMVDQRESAPINYRTNPIRGGNGVLAPTFSQVFRWFREKYSLIAEFNWHFPSKCYATSIYPNDFYLQTKSYEEAELACLDKLIEIAESKSE